ncbi:hypothetical protein NX059_008978 [Plenodomus lindquistii]|nr:hypothetical protein NX059_008978 [Plenodomus lindquistii]
MHSTLLRLEPCRATDRNPLSRFAAREDGQAPTPQGTQQTEGSCPDQRAELTYTNPTKSGGNQQNLTRLSTRSKVYRSGRRLLRQPQFIRLRRSTQRISQSPKPPPKSGGMADFRRNRASMSAEENRGLGSERAIRHNHHAKPPIPALFKFCLHIAERILSTRDLSGSHVE